MVLDPKPASILEPPPALPAVKSDSSAAEEEDLYGRLKSLQRQIEFIDIQEEYVKDELKNLKRELLRAQEEVKRIQSVPLVIGQFMEMVDQNNGIVGSTTGSNYYVRILSTINRELLKPSASVALHRHSNALVDVLPPEADSSISLLSQSEKPDVTYNVSQFCCYAGFRVEFEFKGLVELCRDLSWLLVLLDELGLYRLIDLYKLVRIVIVSSIVTITIRPLP